MAGDTLQLAPSPVRKSDAGSDDQVLDRAGTEDFVGARQVDDASGQVDGHAANLPFDQLDFAGMDAGPNLDLWLFHDFFEGLGATNGLAGALIVGGFSECGQGNCLSSRQTGRGLPLCLQGAIFSSRQFVVVIAAGEMILTGLIE